MRLYAGSNAGLTRKVQSDAIQTAAQSVSIELTMCSQETHLSLVFRSLALVRRGLIRGLMLFARAVFRIAFTATASKTGPRVIFAFAIVLALMGLLRCLVLIDFGCEIGPHHHRSPKSAQPLYFH